MEKIDEVTYIERSYFWPFVFCAGVIVGVFVMTFVFASGLNKVQGTLDLTKICGVKK